jgi:hypothetical protein
MESSISISRPLISDLIRNPFERGNEVVELRRLCSAQICEKHLAIVYISLSCFSLKKKGPKNSRQNDPLPRILSGLHTLNSVKFESVDAL